MAITQLTDVIIPEVYQTYAAVNSPEKTALYQSGIIVSNSGLNAKANEGGETLNVPFWKDLDASAAPNLSNDTEDVATPQKVDAGRQIARVAYVNQGYKSADLTGEIAGSDPMQQVRNRFGTYWMKQWQRRLIASTNGILADNIANDAGDMVIDVAANATGSVTADTRFNRDVFTDAVFTMGDSSTDLSAIGVHSQVLQQMVKNDDIVYMPDSTGKLTIPTYMGLRVIVDDGMTVTAGTTSGFKYTSVLFGAGAFGYGEGTAKTPVELDRGAAQGNGGGVETLWERKTWLLHPFGFATGTAPAAVTYSLAELSAAASWDRVVERKSVPLAYLVTN
jgi:hypothetical protein